MTTDRPKLIPGLSHPSVPMNPNGTGHCPRCGANQPMGKGTCQAPDCEREDDDDDHET